MREHEFIYSILAMLTMASLQWPGFNLVMFALLLCAIRRENTRGFQWQRD